MHDASHRKLTSVGLLVHCEVASGVRKRAAISPSLLAYALTRHHGAGAFASLVSLLSV